MKVVLITNIPNPYRVPLLNELNRQLVEHDVTLHVIFGAETYSRRRFKLDPAGFLFRYSILSSAKFTPADNEKTVFFYNGILRAIIREKPDKIIVSGFSLATLKVFLYCLFYRVPYLIWNGSILSKKREDHFLKRFYRRILAHSASAFIVYGTRAKEYIMSLGIAGEKIVIGINTVDTSFFSTETERLRLQMHLKDQKKHLLYIGYLSARKNVRQVLEVIRLLAQRRSDVVLDLVGSGDSLPELEAFVKEHRLEPFVCFHGFKQREQLPEFLAACSVFLFQTGFDIWGLVLNEAMAARLPVICSPNAGAAEDLIRDGETGFIFDYDNPTLVADKVEELLNDPGTASRIGSNAAKFIRENASLSNAAGGFIRALNLSARAF